MAFTQKLINVQLTLANGEFQGGGNTVTISGHRVSFMCAYVGGYQQSEAHVSIYGLPLSVMNQMSTVGKQLDFKVSNLVKVFAGDAKTGMTIVYDGMIIDAYVDAQAMPNVAFRIKAGPSPYHAVTPAAPISVNGTADAADLMKTLAGKMGLKFENAGVTAKLSNSYYAGSLWTQAQQIAKHGGFDWIVDRGTLAIVQPGKAREGDAILISPETGMVGYPMFNEARVIVRCLFNTNFKHYGIVEIKSDLTPACGKWTVIRTDLELDSMIPNGHWFMTLYTRRADVPGGPA